MYKKVFKNKKAVTFDLDGTLVKTKDFWDQAFRVVCDEVLLEWPGFEGLAGLGLKVIWDRLLSAHYDVDVSFSIDELSQKTEQEFKRIISELEIEEGEGFWDLAYELKEEKGFKLALVTNSSKETTESILSTLGIDKTFDVVLTGSDVKKQKPSPEIYKEAAKRLGVKPSQIVSFEDSPAGAKSAVDAGCAVVVVYDGDFSEKDYPSKVMTMVSGFDDVAGRMDLTLKEVMDKTAEQVVETEQSQES